MRAEGRVPRAEPRRRSIQRDSLGQFSARTRVSALGTRASNLVSLFFDGLTEAADDAGNLFGGSKQIAKSGLGDVARVEGHIQMRLDLGTRRASDGQIAEEVGSSITLESF